MNYRHAFHAGNHLDVFKHASLTILIERLAEKPAPFAVLDTHAGAGLYDLSGERALKTGEATDGVGRIFGRPLAAAPSYSRVLHALNPDGLLVYPGSPEIARRLMRPGDRLIVCELHPQEAGELKQRYRGDRRVAVHVRDGYEAVNALLPPAERRGLVLIDPPFELPDEAERLEQALIGGLNKWPTGVFAAWYPVKQEATGVSLARSARLNALPKALRAEFRAYATGEAALQGGGLVICNAPWRVDLRLSALCQELAGWLGAGHASWTVEQLTTA
jgi:23S rRNA (adenine2030-N6)-methyltransferase